MTAARQKKRRETCKTQLCKNKTVKNRAVIYTQKNGVKMEHGYAIIMRRTKRIVGFAQTIDVARAGLDAVAVPFRQNFQIIPYVNRVPANEK